MRETPTPSAIEICQATPEPKTILDSGIFILCLTQCLSLECLIFKTKGYVQKDSGIFISWEGYLLGDSK